VIVAAVYTIKKVWHVSESYGTVEEAVIFIFITNPLSGFPYGAF